MFQDSLQLNLTREWILTNSLGGYALGFGNFINKRKYNGLLIASDENQKRTHLLSSMDEKIEADHTYFHMDSNHYLNCIHPQGYSHIVRSWLRPYPAALYSSNPWNKKYLVFKEIFFSQNQNVVIVKYSNLGESGFSLTLRPKFTFRDHHSVNRIGRWDREGVGLECTNDSFRVSSGEFKVFGYLKDAHTFEDKVIYRGNYYPLEGMRGYEAAEDTIAPIRSQIRLEPGQSCYYTFSDTALSDHVACSEEAERYYKSFPLPNDHPESVSIESILTPKDPNTHIFDKDDYLKILELAANDFIIDNDIIAGYPWFGCWGRDTLIAMEGLKYLKNGHELAKNILLKYGEQIKDGLIPNIFGEGGEGLNYDTVDAPLWYVLRAYEYAPKDKTLFDFVSKIVLNYLKNGNLPFFVDGDGLIEIREGNQALTWMDAKIYGVPVTPRSGKPIEINALWFNALSALREMATHQKVKKMTADSFELSIRDLDKLKVKVAESLQLFVGEDYLADRIINSHPVWETRPNAIIALSLPFDFVSPEITKKTWETAKKELLTPYGLRSLSPKNPGFKSKYIGNQKQRDYAYHQGTVWAFLLLPYANVLQKILKKESSGSISKELSNLVWTIREGFLSGERASVAEIWDGIEPSTPKGCPAQAWSLFSLLTIENMILSDRKN